MEFKVWQQFARSYLINTNITLITSNLTTDTIQVVGTENEF